MQIQTFLKTVIAEICNGIRESQAEVDGAVVNPLGVQSYNDLLKAGGKSRNVQLIEFDLAVTVNSTEKSETGGGVMMAPLFWGGRETSSADSSTTTRVKFSVPVAFPSGGEIPKNPEDELKPAIF